MRAPDWQRRLNEYLLEAEQRYKAEGFAWGAFDCVTFVSGWVKACTGQDFAPEFTGRYTTVEEAAAVAVELGGSLAGALEVYLGAPVAPAFAQRGDLAYLERPGDVGMCGIFFTQGGRAVALFLGEGGFILHRARHVTAAFHVG